MPTVKFVQYDGTEQIVQTELGRSIMQAATDNAVRNLLAECGGGCACGTCHGYIREPWSALVPAAEEAEIEMLEFALHVNETSRLTCQIKMTPELDGIVVHLPESQI